MALKILFADDSMTAQNMGKKILSDAGYEVVAVSNGAAALKKINEIKPQLVVLDVYMPGYTGLEVCEKMRSAHETSNTPVLLTVGKMEAYKAEDGARVKADGVIVKPFEATDLLAAIEKLTGGLKAAGAANAADEAKQTVTMPTPGTEEAPHPEPVEEIRGTKPESVSVPSEMASHAAYGFDDLLSSAAHSEAPGASVQASPAPVVKSAAAAPAISAVRAEQPQTSVTAPQAENSLETEFAVSPLEISSTPEYGASTSFNSDFREPDLIQEEKTPEAKPAKPSLLERFDAILKGGHSKGKAAGFEATAVEPTPDVPVATEPGLEVTVQRIDTGSIEITPEPGLDPFSSEATATAHAEYQSWDTSEPNAAASGPASVAPAAREASIETVSLHQYVSPDVHAEPQFEVQPESGASEPSVLTPETNLDDFEKRVAEAMADFQSSATGQEHEIASAITEREAEDAELAQSKHAVAHETELAHEITASTESFDVAPIADLEITEVNGEATAEPYVIEETIPHTPLKAAAAAASTGSSELERALAEAVAAQNHKAAPHIEGPNAEAAASDGAPKPLEATMITKIVTRVLEHSLPDILNKVMAELEKEEREKKK